MLGACLLQLKGKASQQHMGPARADEGNAAAVFSPLERGYLALLLCRLQGDLRVDGGCRERGSLPGSQPALPALQQRRGLWPHAPCHSRIQTTVPGTSSVPPLPWRAFITALFVLLVKLFPCR